MDNFAVLSAIYMIICIILLPAAVILLICKLIALCDDCGCCDAVFGDFRHVRYIGIFCKRT